MVFLIFRDDGRNRGPVSPFPKLHPPAAFMGCNLLRQLMAASGGRGALIFDAYSGQGSDVLMRQTL